MKLYVNVDYINKVFRVAHGFPKAKISVLYHAIMDTFEGIANQENVTASEFADAIDYYSASANTGENRLDIELALFNSTSDIPLQAIRNIMNQQLNGGRILPLLLEVTAKDLQSPEDYIIPIMSYSKKDPEKNFMVACINWRMLVANAQAVPDKNTNVFLYPIIIDLNTKVIGTLNPEAVQSIVFAKREDSDESSGE